MNNRKLKAAPMTIAAAKKFVSEWHRHHTAPQGGLWAVGAEADGEIVGVAIVGRPVARNLQDGKTVEVIRVATNGHKNACSFLYGVVKRAAKELGWKRIVTYTLDEESGSSLRAIGAERTAHVEGRSWNCKKRPRTDKSAAQTKDKWRWTLFSEVAE